MGYWVVKAILGPLLAILFRPWSEGADNVPREGPAILASNHLSFSDHFFGPLPLPAQGDVPGQVGVLHRARGEGPDQQGLLPRRRADPGGPVGRRGQRGGAATPACACWARGSCSASTPRAPARRTAGSTAARPAWPGWRWSRAAPVIPCAMIGTYELQPPGPRAARGCRSGPGVRFGKPLDFSRYAGMKADRFVLRSITDEIMYALMNLSGQEYVDDVRDQGAKKRRSRPAASAPRQSRHRMARSPTSRSTPPEPAGPPSTDRPATRPDPLGPTPLSASAAGPALRALDRAAASDGMPPRRRGRRGSNRLAQPPGAGQLVGRRPHAGAEPGQERRAQAGGLQHLRALDRDAELVGLQLQSRSLAAAPPSTRSVGRSRRSPVTITSKTSRTSKAIASRVARTRCARGGAAGDPDDRAPRVGIPVRARRARSAPARTRRRRCPGRSRPAPRSARPSSEEPSPSRSHWMAAPVTKTAPSSA